MKAGDKCPECGGKPMVYDSRFNAGYRRRGKKCKICGHTWFSIEIIEPEESMYIRIPIKDTEKQLEHITRQLFGEDIEIIKT